MANNNDLMYSKVVEFLSKDGAICNFDEKHYDEIETQNHPIGNRGLFKKYNDTITKYHNILKYLNGEVRANITESIPVIDYANISMTSLLGYYGTKEDGSLDTSDLYYISSIESDVDNSGLFPNHSDKMILDLQLNQENELNPERHLINRAVMNQDAAKLFYNTTEENKSENYILTDYYKPNNFFFKYKGFYFDYAFFSDSLSDDENVEKLAIRIAKVTDEKYIEIKNIGHSVSESTAKNYRKSSTSTELYSTDVEISNGNISSIDNSIFTDNGFITDGYVVRINGTVESPVYVVVIPSTIQNVDYHKVLIYQQPRTISISDKTVTSYKVNEPYQCFVIYTEDEIDSNIAFESIVYNDDIDDTVYEEIKNPIIFKDLQNYLYLYKVYYLSASGILNGQYSYPYKYKDSSDTVTKWALMLSGSSYINDGYKYFAGHVLNRGNFIASPLKITNSDKVLEGNNHTLSDYHGKLSLYYDNIESVISDLYKSISYSTVSEWKNKISSNVNDSVMSVVNFYDLTYTNDGLSNVRTAEAFGIRYANKGETMLHPKKSKIDYLLYKDTDITDQFEKIIDSFYGVVGSGYYYSEDMTVLNLDLSTGKVAYDTGSKMIANDFLHIFDSNTYTNSDTTFHSQFVRDAYSDSSVHCYINYNRKFVHDTWDISWKNYKPIIRYDLEDITNPTIVIATPYDCFIKEDDKDKVNTENGQSDGIFIYTQPDNYLSQTCYYITKSPIQNLKAQSDQDNGPDSIVSFVNTNNQTMISFRCVEVKEFLPSKIGRVMIHDPFCFGYLDDGQGGHNFGSEDWVKNSGNFTIIGTDSYIYRLTLINIDIATDTLEFYDRYDKPISSEQSVVIRPMSFPENYFKASAETTEGGIRYLLEEDGFNFIQGLKDSNIVVGYPPESSKNILNVSGNNKASQISRLFYRFYNERNEQIKNKVRKNLLDKIVNLEVTENNSSKNYNPIRVKDLDSIYISYQNIYRILKELSINKSQITINNETTTILPLDYLYIQSLLNGSKNDSYYIDDFVTPSSINKKEGSATLSQQIKAKLENQKIYFHKKNISNNTYFYHVYDIVNRINNYPESVTRQDFVDLDLCFGNETESYINTKGGSEPESLDIYTPSLSKVFTDDMFESKMIDKIEDGNISYVSHYVSWNLKIIEQITAYIVKSIELYYGTEYINIETAKNIYEYFVRNGLNISVKGYYKEDNNVKKFYSDSSYTSPITLTSGIFYEDIITGTSYTLINNDLVEWPQTYYLDIEHNILYKEDFTTVSSPTSIDLIDGFIYQSYVWADQHFNTDEYESYLYNNGEFTKLETTDSTKNIVFPSLYICDDEKIALINSDYKIVDGEIDKSDINNELNIKKYGYANVIVTIKSNFVVDSSNKTIAFDETSDSSNDVTISIPIYLEDISYGDSQGISAQLDFIPFYKLDMMMRFIKKSLNGENDGNISFLSKNGVLNGPTESLYYKRYKALNSRMNTLDGDLYLAGLTIRNMDFLIKKNNLSMDIVDSFANDMLIIPIESMTEAYWLPEQQATSSTAPIEGKLYDKKIMDSMRDLISDRCVLTCRSCTLKSVCPFYNEEEVIKIYVPEIEYLQFNVKDNNLNLISEKDFNIVSSKGQKLDYSDYSAYHNIWSSIEKYHINGELISDKYRLIEKEEERLSDILGEEVFSKENPQGLGWLTKARYGTVVSNEGLKSLKNKEYDPSQLYQYQYLYNAVFINDTSSYVKYSTSTGKYKVEFDKIDDVTKETVHYSGTVRLEMPRTLDFSYDGRYTYSDDDLLFLVSDDRQDEEGNTIVPLIYLNTLGFINQYTVFDMNEIGNVDDEIVSEDDTTVYPKDVAQWSINIMKGDYAEEAANFRNNSTYDVNFGHDQYWMTELRKKIKDIDGKDKWITIKGRNRVRSTAMPEVLMSLDNINEFSIISGKPTVGTYIDFTRLFSINVKAINWVLPGTEAQISKELGLSTSLTYKQLLDKQKSTLPCMKTNPRFVLVKRESTYTL